MTLQGHFKVIWSTAYCASYYFNRSHLKRWYRLMNRQTNRVQHIMLPLTKRAALS